MGTQSEVRDDEGNVTHIRETSDDGRTSELYTVDNSVAAYVTGDHRGEKVEIADHNPDGTTRAYEVDNSLAAYITGDHRGEEKSDSSCCYIVGACLDSMGLPRSSLEMKAMKVLAKDHILKSFKGKRDYITYGKIGPKIVEAINAAENPQTTWKKVYEQLRSLTPTIECGKYQEAYDQYKSLVFGLKAEFAS